jgi:hypothetical protein
MVLETTTLPIELLPYKLLSSNGDIIYYRITDQISQ